MCSCCLSFEGPSGLLVGLTHVRLPGGYKASCFCCSILTILSTVLSCLSTNCAFNPCTQASHDVNACESKRLMGRPKLRQQLHTFVIKSNHLQCWPPQHVLYTFQTLRNRKIYKNPGEREISGRLRTQMNATQQNRCKKLTGLQSL